MSKPARTSTPGSKVQPPPLPTHETGRVSGARRALNYSAYDGLMQLGSDAFTAPLPPPKSERPRFSPPRIHAGWYMISAAAGFSVGAVVLAIVFKPSLTPERPPVSLAHSAGYIGPWTMVTKNEPVQMREVLEPVQPIDAPPAQLPAAAASAKVEPAAPAQVAEHAAPEQAAAPAEAAADTQTSQTEPTPSEPMATAQPQPHASHTEGSRAHRHERQAAPVAQLSRAQVIAAMQKVQPEVSACFHGTNGTANADVTILGRTGRVTTAQVSGQNGAVGSCIARAVRKATFPTFKAETLSIRYPFAH
jgi:hypothetical protein